jgi:hypothetical protein
VLRARYKYCLNYLRFSRSVQYVCESELDATPDAVAITIHDLGGLSWSTGTMLVEAVSTSKVIYNTHSICLPPTSHLDKLWFLLLKHIMSTKLPLIYLYRPFTSH